MKNNLILFIVLFVLGVISYFVIKGDANSETKSQLLIPELQNNINDVDGVKIRKNDKTITLVKQSGIWRIVEAENFLADANKVASLLLDLRKMNLREKKTSNAKNYSKLQLAENGENAATNISLSIKNKQITELAIGKQAQHVKGTYVRIVSDPQSWLSDGVISAKLEAKDWIVTTILDIDSSQIKSVSYASEGDEPFTIDKITPNDENFIVKDMPENKQLKTANILNEFANGLSKFSIESAQPKTEFVKTDLKVSYHTFSGVQYDLSISKSSDDYLLNINFINVENLTEFEKQLTNWTYKIPSYKSDALNKNLSDVLEDKIVESVDTEGEEN